MAVRAACFNLVNSWFRAFGCRSLLGQTKHARGGQFHCCVHTWSLSVFFFCRSLLGCLQRYRAASSLPMPVCVQLDFGEALERLNTAVRQAERRYAHHASGLLRIEVCHIYAAKQHASWHSCTCWLPVLAGAVVLNSRLRRIHRSKEARLESLTSLLALEKKYRRNSQQSRLKTGKRALHT